MSKIKAGVVGCGGIADSKHLPAAIRTNLVEFVAFCDIAEKNAAKSREKFGAKEAKIYTDYKIMLEEKSIEVLYICTPNRLHSEIAVAALESGKHVMCEKPMAINAKEADKMLKAAKEAGKLLTVGYQYRYFPEYQYTKKLIEEGGLGDIYFVRAKAIRRRAVPTWGLFLDEYEQGGGPLIDIGTHVLDLALWTMGNYKPKYAVGTVYHKLNNQKNTGNLWGDWDTDKFKVEDSAFGFIVMENGATIILESSFALNDRLPREGIITLCGTKAGVDFYDGLHINNIQGGCQSETKVNLPYHGLDFDESDAENSPNFLEQSIFLNAVLGKNELLVTPEQAYTVTLILDAIYESAKTGKPVYF